MTGTDIARRHGGGLSPVLEQAGVQVQESDDGRFRSITFPDEITKHVNLLLPVQELVQADPNYTPTVRAVRLDPSPDGPHFYNQGTKRSPKLAPRKQALEVLADTAGMRVAHCRPMRRDELDAYPEGTIGYEATVVLRRSDGTPQEITRHKIWEREVEEYAIQQAILTATEYQSEAPKYPTEQARTAEFRKRWLAENQHKGAKTESKAILRAIRAALQIPHTFTVEQAARPFLVVGYSFTPDYTDPEVRRLLVEHGLGVRTEEVYGRPALAAATDGIQAADETAAGRGDALPAGPSEPEEAVEEPDPSPPAASEGEPPEPPAAGAADGSEDPGAYVLPPAFTKYAGKTVAHVAEEAKDAAYLAYLCGENVTEPTRSAARAYVEASSRG